MKQIGNLETITVFCIDEAGQVLALKMYLDLISLKSRTNYELWCRENGKPNWLGLVHSSLNNCSRNLSLKQNMRRLSWILIQRWLTLLWHLQISSSSQPNSSRSAVSVWHFTIWYLPWSSPEQHVHRVIFWSINGQQHYTNSPSMLLTLNCSNLKGVKKTQHG